MPPLSPNTELRRILPAAQFQKISLRDERLNFVLGERGEGDETPHEKRKVKFVDRLTENTGALQGMGARS